MSTIPKLRPAAFRLFAFSFAAAAVLVFSGVSRAESPLLPEEAQESVAPEGSHYEWSNGTSLTITVETSEPVDLALDAGPGMVVLDIQASVEASASVITVNGLSGGATYWVYEDDYHGQSEVLADATGTLAFSQDLATGHIVFIQPVPSTVFIRNDATGGDCDSIGVWDAGTLKCTLTADLAGTV